MGFVDFIIRSNYIYLSVGVVVGLAFNSVIEAFIADLITPLFAAISGNPNFANLSFSLNSSTFLYGNFINAFLTLILTCVVIYYLVICPLEKYFPKPITKNCNYCCEAILINATKCKFCTSDTSDISDIIDNNKDNNENDKNNDIKENRITDDENKENSKHFEMTRYEVTHIKGNVV